MMKRTCLAVTVLLLAVSVRARGAGAGGVSLQVSDQFKKVAKHLGEQYIVKKLKEACKQPLCEVVVDHLVRAFDAAVAGDNEGVRGALRAFFTEASVTGLLHIALRDVKRLPNKVQSKAFGPIARCISSHLTDKATANSCDVGDAAKKLLMDAKLLDTGTADDSYVDTFFKDVGANKRPSMGDSIRVMAAIASSDKINRPQVRVYLLTLEHVVKEGLEGGLFKIAQRLKGHELGLIVDLGAGVDLPLFRSAPFDSTLSNKIKECGGDPEPYKKWLRERADVKTHVKTAVNEDRPIDEKKLALLRRLKEYTCEGDSPDAQAVRSVVTQSQTLYGEMRVHNLRVSYGLQLLAVAAVLDYVRSSNEQQLGNDLRAIALVALSRVSKRIPEAKGKPVCELEYVRMRLESVKGWPGDCYSIVLEQFIERPKAAAVKAAVKKLLAVADSSSGDDKAKALSDAADLTEGLAVAKQLWDLYTEGLSTDSSASEILEKVLHFLDKSSVVTSLTGNQKKAYEVAKKALRYLVDDRRDAAAKVVSRFALELLLEHVEQVTQEFLSADHADCETQNRSSQIFNPTDAKCVALVLIQAAYGPIADALWDGTIDAKTSPNLASKVYKDVLKSKFLAGSPIILNVGLGVSHITGREAIWGEDGTTAFTLVDKFGLAFYRYVGDSYTFETGPFVGGFLDAIVRSVADADEERRHWLLGYAVGLPRMLNSDFGLELHVGAAMPFSISDASDFYDGIGFALGAVAVIPWNVYDEGK